MKLKLTSLCINKAKTYDETIRSIVKLFEHGNSQVNSMLHSKLGKEYRVASLLKEMSIDNEISEESFKIAITSTYCLDKQEVINKMMVELKQQLTE